MAEGPKPSRRSDVAPFYVMEVMKAAGLRQQTHGDVLHLEVGQPGTPAPDVVRLAAADLLEANRLGYTDAVGIRPLREAIAAHHGRTGNPVDPDRVVVTVGASGGFVLALLAAFDPGDRIGITEPGYAAYRNIIEALGLELVGVRVDAESRWIPTPERVAAAGPLDGIVVASPSNPTGSALTEHEMEAIVGHCAETGTTFLSDEIYHGISYTHPPTSALALSDDALVIQSFSKYFSMTGWRLGWLVVPPSLSSSMERLAQNLFIAPPTLAQYAAVAAFEATAQLDANVERYARSRRTLIDALDRWELPYAPPDGAFYLWVDVSDLGMDSMTLASTLLTDVGVAVTPGVDFDPARGRDFIRISYSEAPDDIRQAVDRIEGWLATRPLGPRRSPDSAQ